MASIAQPDGELVTALGGRGTLEPAPDFLAVRSGSHITPRFAGAIGSDLGGTITGWVDGEGNNAVFFATGEAPNAVKGLAITYGSASTSRSRDAFTEHAMEYLESHKSDARKNGLWNQPTFDGRSPGERARGFDNRA